MSEISLLEMIQQAVLAFVNADSWSESQRIVQSEQALLLTDDADAILAALLAEYADDTNTTGILTQHRDLLRHCRAEGIEAAFAELMSVVPSAEETNALLSLVNAFVQCDGPLEVIKLATEHPELLSDEMDGLLEQSIAGVQAQGIEESEAYGQHMLEGLMTLRRLCQMMRENQMSLDEVVEAMQTMQKIALDTTEQSTLIVPLQDFVTAETWAKSKRVVEAHPELLTDEALEMLDALIAQAKEAGEGGVYHEFIEHRDLLQRCRVEGIEAAFADKIRHATPDVLLELMA